MPQWFAFHNIVVKLTCGLIKSWWGERAVIASNMPLTCVKPQGQLWPGRPCWVDTLITLWLVISLCVCWPSEAGVSLLQNCTRKYNKKHAFFYVFTIWFDRYQLVQFSHLLFCILITVFHPANYRQFYRRCYVSCPLNFNYSHVVLFKVLPSVPRFHPACTIF